MLDFTKEEKKEAKELLKKGILKCHAEWLRGLKELLDSPFEEGSNEFERTMDITKRSRDFYKEAMRMEDYYNSSKIFFGILNLYNDGYLIEEEISTLPERIQQAIKIWNKDF